MDNRLLVFLATAREGHITGAARLLNLSVSAASHQIAQLELEFSTPLFVRGNRGMRLTPAGETLFAYANQIEALWQTAYREVRQTAEGEQWVHVAASHTVTEFFVPEPLGQFRRTHPAVHIHLTMANSTEVISQVETGRVDFGIAEGRVGHRNLKVTNLWQDQLGLIVASHHPLATRTAVTVKDLESVDLILREEGSGTRSILDQALAHHGLGVSNLRVTAELSSIRAILDLVRNNIGCSVMSWMIARNMPDITFLPIEDLQLTRRIHLIRRPTNEGRSAMEHLIDQLVRAAREFNLSPRQDLDPINE
ncbi:LysR family transcriptional regulator [Sulfobacillus thermosulfidooxidans]|uniref:LysR family transcriptional regulator n=1 Tax=Sulfobacillus thermosulfidooxidans TaxID=28034 RepID=UPI0002FABC2C|nr:LysR family transcriptional regulator [Sulfobacillus thermosulfidooxidans]